MFSNLRRVVTGKDYIEKGIKKVSVKVKSHKIEI